MVRSQITVTIDKDILKKIERMRDRKNPRAEYPGASRSFVVEQLLRRSLPLGQVSVAT